jgi:wolfamin
MAVISSQGATWYGLIRSTLALVGLVLFLPLAGLATILLPVAAVGKYLADSAVLVRVTATVALASLPLALSWYLGHCRAHGTAGGFIDKLITRVQVMFV